MRKVAIRLNRSILPCLIISSGGSYINSLFLLSSLEFMSFNLFIGWKQNMVFSSNSPCSLVWSHSPLKIKKPDKNTQVHHTKPSVAALLPTPNAKGAAPSPIEANISLWYQTHPPLLFPEILCYDPAFDSLLLLSSLSISRTLLISTTNIIIPTFSNPSGPHIFLYLQHPHFSALSPFPV